MFSEFGNFEQNLKTYKEINMFKTKKFLAVLCFCTYCVMGYSSPSAADACEDCINECKREGRSECGTKHCSGPCWDGGGE